MKCYAALNNRNQIVRQANLFELNHFCKNSADNLNIVLFRAGESHGRIVASFEAGTSIRANLGTTVSADALRKFHG